MVVRKYVVDAIDSGNGQPIRFPSTRKLGEILGVSQPTALRAIRDLITDGILEPCKNGGTVSCPSFRPSGGLKIFGILTNVGKLSFEDYYFCSINAAVSLELTRRSENFCIQSLYLESPSLLDKTIQENSLAGLIMLDSREQIAENARNLKKRGLPVVSFLRAFAGISSFHSPLKAQFYRVVKKMLSEQRTHLLIVSWPDEDIIQSIREGAAAACREAGIPEGQVIIIASQMNECPPRIAEMLDFGMKFEGVIFYPFARGIFDLLRSRLDTEQECRLVCDECSVYDELKYTGYVVCYNFRAGAKEMVDDLLLQMAQPESPSVEGHINFELKYYKDGQEL